ncbi:hypothetical protein niasHT_004110 [Heterodera trifolii]|uniref:Uncharacterized protein n=1 Tax=Heterodera trifolii TaxID=157864 RepID=A0ABD2LSZ8_9BILA
MQLQLHFLFSSSLVFYCLYSSAVLTFCGSTLVLKKRGWSGKKCWTWSRWRFCRTKRNSKTSSAIEEEEACLDEKQQVLSSPNVGENMATVQGLLKKHDTFEVGLQMHQQRIDELQ